MEKKSPRSFVIPVWLLVLAYEWLISSINKMMTKNYYENLRQQMAQSVSGILFKPYANLVELVGLPNYHVIGVL